MKSELARRNVMIPDDMWERLRALSYEKRVSISELIRRALASALEDDHA